MMAPGPNSETARKRGRETNSSRPTPRDLAALRTHRGVRDDGVLPLALAARGAVESAPALAGAIELLVGAVHHALQPAVAVPGSTAQIVRHRVQDAPATHGRASPCMRVAQADGDG